MCSSDLRRLSEVVSLAHIGGETRSSLTCTLALFRYIYLTAAHLDRRTDLVITVNPRHVAFYRAKMLFEVIGSERAYGKVGGAPAVLLRLDLVTAPARYQERFGTARSSLWHYFCDPERTAKHLRAIWRDRRPLDALVLRHFFVEQRDLLSAATPEQRDAVFAGCPELTHWLT